MLKVRCVLGVEAAGPGAGAGVCLDSVDVTATGGGLAGFAVSVLLAVLPTGGGLLMVAPFELLPVVGGVVARPVRPPKPGVLPCSKCRPATSCAWSTSFPFCTLY